MIKVELYHFRVELVRRRKNPKVASQEKINFIFPVLFTIHQDLHTLSLLQVLPVKEEHHHRKGFIALGIYNSDLFIQVEFSSISTNNWFGIFK